MGFLTSFQGLGLLIIAASVIVGFAMLIVYIAKEFIKWREREQLSLVEKSSTRLNALRQVAENNHIFCDIPKVINIEYPFNSKRALDNAKKDEILIYLAVNDLKLKELSWKILANRAHSKVFNETVNSCKKLQTPSSVIAETKIAESKFYQLEDKLCQDFLNSIRYDSRIEILMTYITPKRGDRYERLIVTDYQGVMNARTEDGVRKAKRVTAAMERAKLSDKLRYEVLQRDHHHCVICGRGAEDGVKLHVDHIMPVSKGGKTELSNLRTLCESCNLGKRDAFDPNGIN